MDAYEGKWEILPAEATGFDEFSAAIGVPEEKRNLMKNLVYVVEYNKDGDNWNVSLQVQGSDQPMNFSWTPGVEFEYAGLDGTTMRSTIKWDGSACHEDHASVTGKWTSVRSVDGDSMTLTSESSGVSMVQKFKRV
ncbi:fatty acid-binding protein 2, liver-like [Haliotis rubra]|uniref:fatty acid-binding protein 2, liver-like n=1 Tax=Haliotis rubra TaxID=36100 RepID=UPI001EE53FD1|nr:fatty acid-binding protein 2, liver-like [Haliotis rubra]